MMRSFGGWIAQTRRIRLLVLISLVALNASIPLDARAQDVLIPMDERQADHLKAYGAAYHPNSHLADRALFEASILQYRRLNDPASAAQTLTRLLTEYPGSMFIQQARSLLRNVRDDSRSDSI